MNPDNARFDNLDNVFLFGKHQGQLLCDVIADDPTYLYWCVNTISEFSISPEAISEIRNLFPNFIIPESFRRCILTNDEYYDKFYPEEEPYMEDTWSYDESPTYERYTGSWAQDVEGYSDDDIETIFDGEPDAYWNID